MMEILNQSFFLATMPPASVTSASTATIPVITEPQPDAAWVASAVVFSSVAA
jgi:hypothetical protein